MSVSASEQRTVAVRISDTYLETMEHRWMLHIVVAGLAGCSLLALATTARADELTVSQPFNYDWSATWWSGAPAGVGLGVARSLSGRWQVRGAVGTPVLLTGVGGTAELVRGWRIGQITLWAGASAAGYVSDNCSWGGCGDHVSYYGVGPVAGLQFATISDLGPMVLIDIGGGFAAAVDRTSNVARVQPLGAVRLGVCW